ncbi:MAG TPA: hypothetical protein PLQ63_12895, partial [Propionicimonas sp.]|nr:hypothetical protein [Propionicimonas sp.]
LEVPDRFVVPPAWGPAYTRLSVNTPAEPHSISAAPRIMQAPIDPVLAGEVRGVWDPRDQDWSVT